MDVLDPSKKIWARARRKAKDLGWTQLMDWCVGERGDARAFIRCRAPSDARCSHFRPAARRRTHQGGHASSAHQNPGAPGRACRGGAGEEERGRAALPERRQRVLHRLDPGSARCASHTAWGAHVSLPALHNPPPLPTPRHRRGSAVARFAACLSARLLWLLRRHSPARGARALHPDRHLTTQTVHAPRRGTVVRMQGSPTRSP